MKRAWCFIMAMLMLIPVLAGCHGETSDTEPLGEITSVADTEPSAPSLEVVSGGKSIYTLVRPEECGVTLYGGCKSIAAALKESLGVEINSVDDWVQGKHAAG